MMDVAENYGLQDLIMQGRKTLLGISQEYQLLRWLTMTSATEWIFMICLVRPG